MISGTDIAKSYNTRSGECIDALTRFSFAVKDGSFVSLVGPSGCGKTTLLKICAGLLSPSSGYLTFDGVRGTARPGSFGIVFQSAALLPWRSVLENILLPADILHLDRKLLKDRAMDLLATMQLSGMQDKYPLELSGGMQQRVAIARALVTEPKVLFMDEPFGALDALTREELNQHLQQIHLQHGKTVLFVTHSIPEAVMLSDRIIVMSARPGRVIADIDVALVRPRRSQDLVSQEFRAIEAEVREMLEKKPGR